MFESFFTFDQKYYKQSYGFAMASPLAPTLTNVFMRHFEKIFLQNCPTEFKPTVYRRYVEDTYLLSPSTEHAENKKSTKTLALHLKLNKMVHCHF